MNKDNKKCFRALQSFSVGGLWAKCCFPCRTLKPPTREGDVCFRRTCPEWELLLSAPLVWGKANRKTMSCVGFYLSPFSPRTKSLRRWLSLQFLTLHNNISISSMCVRMFTSVWCSSRTTSSLLGCFKSKTCVKENCYFHSNPLKPQICPKQPSLQMATLHLWTPEVPRSNLTASCLHTLCTGG